jgi:HD-GYP domain-containing protein (c-di-GMP phosphodiesterase class II)
MNRQLSLATRAFLFAFFPMVLTLIVSFVAVSQAVEGRIKDRLRESLQKTELTMARREADYSRRSLGMLSALTENASLKAGIGLLKEIRDPRLQEQVHETLAGQLQEMGQSLDYDLLLLQNPLEKPVVAVVGRERMRLAVDPERVEFLAPSLLRVRDKLYEAASVPVNLGAENLGTLVVGKEFHIETWNMFGDIALIRDGSVFLTTFPAGRAEEAGRQVRSHCGSMTYECEVEIRGEAFLAMPVRQETFKGSVRLISFQSIDAAAEAFTEGVAGVFPLIGGGGVLLVFLFSVVGARSIARPLVSLIAQLRKDGAERFPAELGTNYRAAEVNELAREFSRAAGAVRESERRLDEATEEFIESMAQAQDARDPYTAGHSERVSANSTAIAVAMGLPPEQVEIIRIGAKLHDIGKIGIPDAVLRKPGHLTREEYILIQRHPLIGKEILQKVARFREFLPIVELHHENPDGSGYPYGLRQNEIPVGVRIVHVADVYDAITSDRAYRSAMSEAQAWKLLQRGRGALFDPDVVEALWAVLRKERSQEEAPEFCNTHENDSAFYSLPYR